MLTLSIANSKLKNTQLYIDTCHGRRRHRHDGRELCEAKVRARELATSLPPPLPSRTNCRLKDLILTHVVEIFVWKS